MKRVIVLGGSGMLGSAVAGCLAREPDLEVHASVRTAELAATCRARVENVRWCLFDAEGGVDDLPERADWIVNAIGIIKPYIQEDDPRTVERAIVVNALLPHRLAARAKTLGARVVQIATDCVFSGAKSGSTETATHNPLDVYGMSKSLGEVQEQGFYNLRCSIVGPEWKERRSLLEWFLSQPPQATVNGFTNHLWNGITSLHFARIVRGMVQGDGLGLSWIQHVVPADTASKAGLLALFAELYGRSDVKIVPGPAKEGVDRSLSTVTPDRNRALWRAAGYDHPPTLREMVRELSQWAYPFHESVRPDPVRRSS